MHAKTNRYKAIYNDWATFYLLHLDVTWAQARAGHVPSVCPPCAGRVLAMCPPCAGRVLAVRCPCADRLHLDVTWAQVYETEPLDGITDPRQQALVLGAEVCKWGENTDASVFDAKVWPRLAVRLPREPQQFRRLHRIVGCFAQ